MPSNVFISILKNIANSTIINNKVIIEIEYIIPLIVIVILLSLSYLKQIRSIIHSTNNTTNAKMILQINGIPKSRIHQTIKKTFPNLVKPLTLFFI